MAANYRYVVPVLVSAAVALSGCNTVKYLKAQPAEPKQANGLPEALSFLGAARLEYQGQVEEQMKSENILANSLVGAGALVMALAVGGANSNIVAGTALAAGTAYGLGNFNLPRQRVLIYLAGVEALDCARKAVDPIVVSADELNEIRTARDALIRSSSALREALNRGRVALQSTAPAAEERAQLGEAIALGDRALEASRATLDTVRTLLQTTERAARDLVTTVKGIDQAVVRSLVLSTPELSSVPGLVSGLAGLSAAFAPGAGVDTLFTSRLEKASNRALTDSAKSEVKAKSPALLATEAILQAAASTNTLDAELQGRLPRQAVPWAEDAFKNCGIAQVVQALSVPESPLTFVAGVNDRRTFVIVGGVKPYFVRLEGVDGLSARSPIRFDNLAEVSLDASKLSADTVKSELRASVRVIDSSPSARSLDVPVIVTPAATAASGAAAKVALPIADAGDAGGGDAATPAADLKRLQKMAQFTFADRTFMLKKTPLLVGDTFEVTVNCPAGDSQVHQRDHLSAALLTQAGITEKRKMRLVTVPAGCAK